MNKHTDIPGKLEPEDYTVRIRFKLPSQDRISISGSTLEVDLNDGRTAILKTLASDIPISKASWLVIVCSGWASASDAESGAERLMDALRIPLIRFQAGADFGRHSERGKFASEFLARASDGIEAPVLDDITAQWSIEVPLHQDSPGLVKWLASAD